MPTIKEVAYKAGVSVGTVSNVLSRAVPVSAELRERVEAAVQALDYHPNHVARSLKIRQTKMLGMVISDITNPFFPQLVRGAEDAAWKHGYSLTTLNSDDKVEREQQIFGVLRTRKMDGILLTMADDKGDITHVQGTINSGTPVVFLDRVPSHINGDSVSVDNLLGARQCVEHLLQAGHRRIAILAGSRDLLTGRNRLKGYEDALAAAGIPLDRSLIRHCHFRQEAGCIASLELLQTTPRPTAIFACNGMMALGLIQAIGDLNLRCPEDVALATFDDLPSSAAFRPRLTAVAQPAYEIGYQGAELLIARLNGTAPPEPVHLVLPTELRVRESSALRAAVYQLA